MKLKLTKIISSAIILPVVMATLVADANASGTAKCIVFSARVQTSTPWGVTLDPRLLPGMQADLVNRIEPFMCQHATIRGYFATTAINGILADFGINGIAPCNEYPANGATRNYASVTNSPDTLISGTAYCGVR